MKKSSFQTEALKLCELIIEHSPPFQHYYVVNLVKSDRTISGSGLIKFESDSSIPVSYLYFHDDIPNYLEKIGVIVGTAWEHVWFSGAIEVIFRGEVGVGPFPNDDLWLEQFPDSTITDLTVLATNLGYINKDVGKINVFKDLLKVKNKRITLFSRNGFHNAQDNIFYDKGPSGYENKVALFDKIKMKKFILSEKSQSPEFDKNSGKFNFRGQFITFTGSKTIPTVELLINNLNSRVTVKDMYLAGGDSEEVYDQRVKSRKLTSISDAMNKRFESIKKKILSNKVLKSTLVMHSEGGYGMFVDQSRNAIDPENSRNNS